MAFLWGKIKRLLQRRKGKWQPTDQEYNLWLATAKKKGWCVPHNDVFDRAAWIKYWENCYAYLLDEDFGRPVPPHRSGGHL